MAIHPPYSGFPGQLTVEAVADHLGLPVDQRMANATEAARAWVEGRRCRTSPDRLWSSADVLAGAVLYAALLYQARSTPNGLSGYDEANLFSPGAANALYRARELVGADPVIA